MPHVDRYELVRRIASGGMAEVFLARTAGPGGFEKQVVLKRILPELAQDPRFAALFMEEAKLSARLGHPNIVQIFDFGEADGSYFIAMEYVDGPSLRAVLSAFKKKGWQIPLEMAARIAIIALEALSYAHEFTDPSRGYGGLIHRDVSPENIIVSRAGGVKLVDFGIAKALSASGEARTTLRRGKHSYMSPEQIRGKLKLDGRVDIFALGVVLFEMITGERPFRRATELATLQAVLFEEPPPLASLRPGIPDTLQTVVMRALRKDRDERYRSAREMIVALEHFLVEDGGRSITGAELSNLARSVETAEGVQGAEPQEPGAAPEPSLDGPTEPAQGPQDAVTVISAPPERRKLVPNLSPGPSGPPGLPPGPPGLPPPPERVGQLPVTQPLPPLIPRPSVEDAGATQRFSKPPARRSGAVGAASATPLDAPRPTAAWQWAVAFSALVLIAVVAWALSWS